MWPLITNLTILVVPSRRSNGSFIRILRFETRLWYHCCAACSSLVVKIVHYFYLFLKIITIPYRFLRSSCRDTLHIVTLASTAQFENHDLRRADAEEILSSKLQPIEQLPSKWVCSVKYGDSYLLKTPLKVGLLNNARLSAWTDPYIVCELQ